MQILCAKNTVADFLARLASSDDYNATPELCIAIKGQPSIEGEQVLKIKEQDESMNPIVRYLKEGWFRENKTEARKIQIRAAHFVIIDDVLYRRGYSLPYLRPYRRMHTTSSKHAISVNASQISKQDQEKR